MPDRWFRALEGANGKPFTDGLTGYGYLPNPRAGATLPIGFVTGKRAGDVVTSVGMTCAACHTRDIEVNGVVYRIDGAPAMVDFQHFLGDLDKAVERALASDAAFKTFTSKVIGAPPSDAQVRTLRAQVVEWHGPYHTLLQRSFPDRATPWGIGRADAIQMIFNRLTGLDLGPAPSHVIADNIQPADSPVRYPFLWNAAKQKKTQWMGFAGNGDDRQGLLRNMGQVYGVFARFQPQPNGPGMVKYWKVNSADIDGLRGLETKMKALGPPRWPWPVDQALAESGKRIFEGKGGCGGCHEQVGGPPWPTPVLQVGTDTRQQMLLRRAASSGVMEGVRLPFGSPLQGTDSARRILTVAVGGSYIEYVLSRGEKSADAERDVQAYAGEEQVGYEARRLNGVWAAAPYLHNGSVATLADLLRPAKDRASSFEVGRAFDPVDVGLAKTQTGLHSTLRTGCTGTNLDSGDSNCGHEYGTTLTDAEKRALIEYLKIY
jgi:hypothetical protein